MVVSAQSPNNNGLLLEPENASVLQQLMRARALGPDRCIALTMFHAFKGCDAVSIFGGRGKRTAWDTSKA